jgi:anaerobic ribonucleoside-triphosphate reductase
MNEQIGTTVLVPKRCSTPPIVRYDLKWHVCPKCGSENFLVGVTKTFCNECDWETAEFPYMSKQEEAGNGS